MNVIEDVRPKLIISENVPQCSTTWKIAMEVLLGALKRLGYVTSWTILNTADFGIPQSRKRWYLLAIRSDVLRPEGALQPEKWWPQPKDDIKLGLASFVTALPASEWKPIPTDKVLHTRNVEHAYSQCVANTINPFVTPIVVDMAASERYSYHMVDQAPTLTKSRCGSFGYWCSTKGGGLWILKISSACKAFNPKTCLFRK